MANNYPEFYEQVSSLMSQFGAESPDTMDGFMQLHKACSKDGALSGKVRELIVLGIAFHVHDAIKAGAAYSEIVETIGVAILMGGGPSVVYGSQALEALKEFEGEDLS